MSGSDCSDLSHCECVDRLYSRIADLRAENQRLTLLLDEGQALALDAGDPETMYRLQRDLAKWASRVNTELYEQAKSEWMPVAKPTFVHQP